MIESREKMKEIVTAGVPMPWAKFTRRETTIAQYLLLGASRCEIAWILKISENTVKSHAQNIFKKAAVKSQKEFMVKHLSANMPAPGGNCFGSGR